MLKSCEARDADILIVSDVSVGYGTPQVLSIARALSCHYRTRVRILEPDQLERPPVLAGDDNTQIERVVTMSHPYSWAGRSEFSLRVARIAEMTRPRILLFSSYYPLPALLNLHHRPELTILYQIEHMSDHQFEVNLVEAVIDRIDLLIFPEPNRAQIDLTRVKPSEDTKALLVYNCPERRNTTMPVECRNRRIFYGGTFDRQRTNAEYFLDDEVRSLPIDIYGQIHGFDDPEVVKSKLAGANRGAMYCGYVRGGDPYFQRLSHYSYSIVMWNPLDEATFNAAPNKLFDAIACGVPPICAPHPICVELILRFKCGMLLDDWSLAGFRDRLKQAHRMVDSDNYGTLVENCISAHACELNWESQWRRIVPFLPPLRMNDRVEGVAGDSR